MISYPVHLILTFSDLKNSLADTLNFYWVEGEEVVSDTNKSNYMAFYGKLSASENQ